MIGYYEAIARELFENGLRMIKTCLLVALAWYENESDISEELAYCCLQMLLSSMRA
ncbi:MAG: hypothetical protein QXR45_13775 [Candidatus Bathyarchaeia archaeon]